MTDSHVNMLNNSVVAAFKHNDQTSKSNMELLIYIVVYITEFKAVVFLRFLVVVYITEFEAVIFLRFLVTAGRVCSIVAMFQHNART